MFGLIPDHIDHIVNGDAANQRIFLSDYRRGDQVVVLEFSSDLAGVHIDRYGRRGLVGQFRDGQGRFIGQQV